MEESIIFAGADARTFAKAWQEMNPIGDTVPPVVLDKKQLAELENIRIVDDGRLYARVCRGGHLTERQITILATKLAVAGVERAQFYSEGYQLLEDWTPQLPRLKADAEAGKSMVIGKPLTDVNLRDRLITKRRSYWPRVTPVLRSMKTAKACTSTVPASGRKRLCSS